MGKSSRFTLLELMICIALLVLCATLLLFSGKGLHERYRLQHKVKEIATHLQLLQTLALSYQSDMQIQFFLQDGVFQCRSSGKEPLPFFRSISLEGIGRIQFNQKDMVKPLTFHIFSSGRIEPKGSLVFQGKEIGYLLDLQDHFHIKRKEVSHENYSPSL